MNNLQIFRNTEFGEVRVVDKDGEPWFVGKDVAKSLGYSNTKDAIINHVDETDRGILKRSEVTTIENHIPKDAFPANFVDGNIPNRGVTIINESGLYSLILSSKLPTAKKFKHWVTQEVLPSIRKHGGYINGQEQMTDEELLSRALLMAQSKIEEKNKQIQRMKPKELFADAVSASKSSILVGDLAKLLKQNGYDIGQRRLFEWLRQNGYLIKTGSSRNLPTQKSMELSLFEIKETTVTHADGHITVNKTPKVTGKGQVYFVNKFLKEEQLYGQTILNP